jgi:membrane-bound ClpP family serine protease
MTLVSIIILLLVGFLLLLVELLLTPGIIVGTFGMLCMAGAVYLTFENYGNVAGAWVLGGTVLSSMFVVIFALKSGIWDRMASKDVISGRVNVVEKDRIKVGDKGMTLSALRPTGNAFISGIRVEVVSQGESIDSHQEVEVIKLQNNRIIVKKTA